MTYEFCHRMRVEFSDTDMARIVHFTRFFHYMEVTEHAFLRSLEMPIHDQLNGRVISWPRGRVECSYKSPLRFGDEFDVHLIVRELRRCSLTYLFRFLKSGRELVAEGSATIICVEMDPVSGKMSATELPSQFLEKVQAAPTEVSCD
jgi:acyl-CoA thioester hydrolase